MINFDLKEFCYKTLEELALSLHSGICAVVSLAQLLAAEESQQFTLTQKSNEWPHESTSRFSLICFAAELFCTSCPLVPLSVS